MYRKLKCGIELQYQTVSNCRPSLSAFVSLRGSDLFSSSNRRNSLADFRSPTNKVATSMRIMLNNDEKAKIVKVYFFIVICL